nr:protein SRG1-like [Ipomoea trifida]
MQNAEGRGIGMGGSMSVASVQELVRNHPENVPERYIQNNESGPMISQVFPDLPEITIVDHGTPEKQKLEWCDLMLLVTTPSKHRSMKYWPQHYRDSRKQSRTIHLDSKRVTDKIFGNLSLLLGLEKEALKDLHREMKQSVRITYYPPCAKPDLVLGISPHSDASTITLLLQEDEISGLQIKYKGRWLQVKPVPSALVNIGDIVEAWSNGMYKSIEHRAVVNEKKARICVATFISPEDEVALLRSWWMTVTVLDSIER